MSDNTSDSDEWFQARKRPVAVEARGPYTDPDEIETLEGDFEVDDEYIDEHGGYYIIRGVEGEEYPCAADIFAKTYERVTGGPTAVSDPNYLESQSCDWHDGNERCESTPAAYVGEIYYACEDHFEDYAEWLETPSPIIHASDGPRLILANGQVVEPMVFDGEGEELFAFQVGQGQTIYGPEVDDAHTKLAFVDDPDPFKIEAVRERLDAYGFGPEGD